MRPRLIALTATLAAVSALACVLKIHPRHSNATVVASPRDPSTPMPCVIPAGLATTIRQLSELLATDQCETAVRTCWSPGSLEQMDRTNLFAKVVDLVRHDVKLRPTLDNCVAAGPTSAFITPEGRYYIYFERNTPEFTAIRFVCIDGHWYVW